MPPLAVVTGASSGLGLATAGALAAAGYEVLCVARREDVLRRACAPDAGGDRSGGSPGAPGPAGSPGAVGGVPAAGALRPVAADVSTAAGRETVRAAVGARSLAALVHGAGVFPRGRIDRLSEDEWNAALATNVTARIGLVVALRDALRGGRVLFVGSDAARTPRPGGAAYSVSKAASEMLWRCLAGELGGEIAFGMAKPGLVETGMLEESLRAPRDVFPAGEVYAAMRERGETIAPDTVARFFRWLLLEADREEFADGIWDIRDAAHHARWLEGPLYVPITRG